MGSRHISGPAARDAWEFLEHCFEIERGSEKRVLKAFQQLIIEI